MKKTGEMTGWLLIITLIVLSWGCWPEAARAQGANDDYQVFAYNDLGMHCFDNDFSIFCLLPPFNVIHAQVVEKGARPKLLNN